MSHDAQETQETPSGVSRRNFIKGVVAGGVAVSSAAYLFRTGPLVSGQAARAGGVERLITLTVNGRSAPRGRRPAGNAGNDAPLQAGAHRHQDRLRPCRVRRLHGARRRCAALLVLGAHPFGARAKKIQTIEGLQAADGTLHPVQRGVVEEQGFQCAFCMSGFIMATVGYLKKNPNPTREQLAHGVSGNLCRCQDYDKILTALHRGAELSRGVANG